MKKLFLSLLFLGLTYFAKAQCSTSIASGNFNNNTFAFVTGQSFKASCTNKLQGITFSKISNISDDLRSTGYKIGIRLKDSQNNILGYGFWSNGSTETDNWYPGAINITADFQCSDILLTANETYVWEVVAVPGNQINQELILFGTNSQLAYSDGAYIKDGIATTTDIVGWMVNQVSSVNALSATSQYTNPSDATSTDGSASFTISGGISSSTATFIWKKNGEVLTNITGSSATNLSIGDYSVEIKKGCSIIKNFSLVAPTLSAEEFSNSSRKLYPNPAINIINIISHKNEKATVFSVDGRRMENILLTKGINSINISKLPKGNYIIRTIDNSYQFIKN